MSEGRKVYSYEPGKDFTVIEDDVRNNSDNVPVIDGGIRNNNIIRKPTTKVEEEPNVIEETNDTPVTEDPKSEGDNLEEANKIDEPVVDSPIEEPKTTVNEDDPVVNDPPTSEEEGEGQDGEGDPIVKEDQSTPLITDNFFIAAAQNYKAKGILPENFELEENLSDDEAADRIEDAYFQHMEKRVNNELLTEFQSEMNKRGYNNDTLEFAFMLQNGVGRDEVETIISYDQLAETDIGQLSDEDKEDYVTDMYIDRGWKDKEIRRAISSSQADGDFDNLLNEASQYFNNRDKEYRAEKNQEAKLKAQQHENLIQQRQALIANVFNTKKLGDENFTEEELDDFEEALYTRSIPVQHQGQVYNLTPFEQFDAAIKNDFGMRLWAFKKWYFRESDKFKMQADAQRKADNNKVARWGKGTKTVTNQTKSDTKVIEKNEPIPTSINKGGARASQTGGGNYVFDNGQFVQIPKK